MQDGNRSLPLEVVLLQRMQVIPSVVRLIEYLELARCFVLVMERPNGFVDLFDYNVDWNLVNMSELDTQKVFSQVLHAVMEMHKLGVVHRDIKDENIMIERLSGRIKILDFGSGAFLKEHDEYFDSFQG